MSTPSLALMPERRRGALTQAHVSHPHARVLPRPNPNRTRPAEPGARKRVCRKMCTSPSERRGSACLCAIHRSSSTLTPPSSGYVPTYRCGWSGVSGPGLMVSRPSLPSGSPTSAGLLSLSPHRGWDGYFKSQFSSGQLISHTTAQESVFICLIPLCPAPREKDGLPPHLPHGDGPRWAGLL